MIEEVLGDSFTQAKDLFKNKKKQKKNNQLFL
jgi:hypothetical protein